jgi:hypothetical protein
LAYFFISEARSVISPKWLKLPVPVSVIPMEMLVKGKVLSFAFPDDEKSMLATIPIHLKVEVDAETQSKWGLTTPIMEWDAAPENLPIFELPGGGKRRRTARRGGRRSRAGVSRRR